MPGGPRLEVPALLLPFDHVGGQILPANIGDIFREPGAPDRNHVGHERIEEPLLLLATTGFCVVAAEGAELLPRLDAQLDASIPQHLPGFALMDLGVHV